MILSKLFILDINFYMVDTAKRKKGKIQRQIHSIQTFQKFLLNYILIYPAPYTKLIDCLLIVFPKRLKGTACQFHRRTCNFLCFEYMYNCSYIPQ